MSDSIGSIGNTNSVSSAASAAQIQNNAKAEVQYYNLKAIGTNRSVNDASATADVPLGAAVIAYAGDPSTPVAPGTSRSSLASTSTPSPQVAPGNPFQAPPPASAQQTAPAGNPWMAPPSAPASSHHYSAPPAASSVSSTSDASPDDEPKKPWHAQDRPTTYRDYNFDDRDERPADTWAPDSKRSAEFAALDNMKLTSPEEALAQWRAQRERAASTSPAAVQAAAGNLQASNTPSTSVAAAAPPPVAMTAPSSAPARVATAGNPWQAPHLAPANGGLTMPPATAPPGPQLAAPTTGAQGFNTPSPAAVAPVDLSAGSYVNPNLSGPTASHVSPPTAVVPAPAFHPTNLMPNLPYLNQGMPGPQGMINQQQFQAMAANMSLGGIGGGNTLGLLGEDPDPESEEASYGMFGSLDGSNQKRNRQGPGASMLQQLGGS